MQEIYNFSDFSLHANASQYEGYEKAAFSMFVTELENVNFSSEEALYNARILDILSFPSSENVFFVRLCDGKILKGGNLPQISH